MLYCEESEPRAVPAKARLGAVSFKPNHTAEASKGGGTCSPEGGPALWCRQGPTVDVRPLAGTQVVSLGEAGRWVHGGDRAGNPVTAYEDILAFCRWDDVKRLPQEAALVGAE